MPRITEQQSGTAQGPFYRSRGESRNLPILKRCRLVDFNVRRRPTGADLADFKDPDFTISK